jgi:D-sedoheptulose 7-phosphate isomerase
VNTIQTAVPSYITRLTEILQQLDWAPIQRLSEMLTELSTRQGQVLICGNGGSAANAVHWATDFLYPMTRGGKPGISFVALPANTSILTCLANDTAYDQIFSRQVEVMGRSGDLLIALSGSGNSPNILRAIEAARARGLRTFGIFGYNGGKALPMVDDALHVKVDDMQIAEDAQMIACHMLMRALLESTPIVPPAN